MSMLLASSASSSGGDGGGGGGREIEEPQCDWGIKSDLRGVCPVCGISLQRDRAQTDTGILVISCGESKILVVSCRDVTISR